MAKSPTGSCLPPTYIQTELFSTASEDFQREIEKDLHIADPDDKNQAIAHLIESANEDTQ